VGRQVTSATCLCCFFFLERAVFWLYQPLTGHTLGANNPTLDDCVYPWLYYQLPEIIPGVAMILFLAPAPLRSDELLHMPAVNHGTGAGTGGGTGLLSPHTALLPRDTSSSSLNLNYKAFASHD